MLPLSISSNFSRHTSHVWFPRICLIRVKKATTRTQTPGTIYMGQTSISLWQPRLSASMTNSIRALIPLPLQHRCVRSRGRHFQPDSPFVDVTRHQYIREGSINGFRFPSDIIAIGLSVVRARIYLRAGNKKKEKKKLCRKEARSSFDRYAYYIGVCGCRTVLASACVRFRCLYMYTGETETSIKTPNGFPLVYTYHSYTLSRIPFISFAMACYICRMRYFYSTRVEETTLGRRVIAVPRSSDVVFWREPVCEVIT